MREISKSVTCDGSKKIDPRFWLDLGLSCGCQFTAENYGNCFSNPVLPRYFNFCLKGTSKFGTGDLSKFKSFNISLVKQKQ